MKDFFQCQSNKICQISRRLLASNYFFCFVIAVCVLQALWYAFSFLPSINDEARHLANITIYSHHLSPFLGQQNPAWDRLGEVTRDGSFMFYYVMSWFLRIARLFTSDTMAQVIALRLVCTAFFATGLVIFRRVFLNLGLAKSVTNLMLLFFVTIPTVAILPATVNYDNLAFLLFSVLLFLAVRAVQTKRASFPILAGIVITGLFMSVVKWSSIGLFLPVALYLIYDLVQTYGYKKPVSYIYESAKKTARVPLALLLLGLIITSVLFIERPVTNVLRYGNPEPACQKVIRATRCQQFADYNDYQKLLKTKPAFFHPQPAHYIFNWTKRMLITSDDLLERGRPAERSVMIVMYALLTIIGVAVTLPYIWTLIKNNRAHQLLLFVALFYAALLVLTEFQSYVTYGQLTAVRARYLIPILPILMYFMTLSLVRLFGQRKRLLVPVALVVLLVATQGGGIVTYLLTTPQTLEWQNHTVRNANVGLKNFVDHLVIN